MGARDPSGDTVAGAETCMCRRGWVEGEGRCTSACNAEQAIGNAEQAFWNAAEACLQRCTSVLERCTSVCATLSKRLAR